MARSRFDNLDEEDQEEILREAGEEFADNGYESASLNAIIERAGISKGSLYYYFENKEDLFETVVERAASELMAYVADFSLEEMTEENFWEEFERVVRRMAEYASEHRWYIRLTRTFYRYSDRDAGPVRESTPFRIWREWTERFVERGRELGRIRDDVPRDLLVETLLAVTEAGDRWFLKQFEEYEDDDVARNAEKFVDLYRRVLEPADELADEFAEDGPGEAEA